MTIAIIGATGQLGGLTVAALLDRGTPAEEILALGRNAVRLSDLSRRGVRTAPLDLEDIDATAAFFGDRTAPVKPAVQPGRRITTLRHQEFGISVRTAMISEHVRDANLAP